jgi:hypothetical protein
LTSLLIEDTPLATQELPLMRTAIPALDSIGVRTVLPAGVDELDEAELFGRHL